MIISWFHLDYSYVQVLFTVSKYFKTLLNQPTAIVVDEVGKGDVPELNHDRPKLVVYLKTEKSGEADDKGGSGSDSDSNGDGNDGDLINKSEKRKQAAVNNGGGEGNFFIYKLFIRGSGAEK